MFWYEHPLPSSEYASEDFGAHSVGDDIALNLLLCKSERE